MGHGSPSSPLDYQYGWTMSGVACPHGPFIAHTFGRRQTWHAIIALIQHKRSENVGRGMLSSPLNRIHCRKTSSVAFHHSHWITHTIGLRRTRHAIMVLGQQTRSHEFGRRITTSPLDNTRRDYLRISRSLLPLDSMHGWMMSGVA